MCEADKARKRATRAREQRASRSTDRDAWRGVCAQKSLDLCHAFDGGRDVRRLRDQIERPAPCCNIRSEEVGDLVGGAVRAVALESFERHLVEALHLLGQQCARMRGVVGDAAPHLHCVLAWMAAAAGEKRLLVDGGNGLLEPSRGHPDTEPAVAEERRAAQRRLGPAADRERNARRRRRCDLRVLYVEELASMGHALTPQQRAQDRDRLVGPATAGARIYSTDRKLVPVLAADTDAENEPAGSKHLDVGKLAGDECRVAQGKQVYADVHASRRVRHQDRRRADERIRTGADTEADVVADRDVVQAGISGCTHKGSKCCRCWCGPEERRKRADLEFHVRHRVTVSNAVQCHSDRVAHSQYVSDVRFLSDCERHSFRTEGAHIGTSCIRCQEPMKEHADHVRVAWMIKGLGPGGAERLLVDTASALDRERFSIEVFYLLPWKGHLVPAFDALGVRVTCLDVTNERDLRWVPGLRREIRQRQFDIVHAHSPYVAAFARLAVRSLPPSTRPRLVTTEHNPWTTFKPATRYMNALTAPLSDATIAVSEEVRGSMSSRTRRRCETLTHGIDVDGIRALRSARDEVRDELGVDHDTFLVGTVANYHPKKDWPNLLRAARHAHDRNPRLRFCAVGQGPLEAEVEALRAELGLEETVILPGYRPDAVRLMAGCDAFMLASQWEGMPVALMEACALSLPIVATAVGGIPERFRAGVDALLVPAHEPEALASAVLAVAENPKLRASLACASARMAPSFDVQRAANRIACIYDELAR